MNELKNNDDNSDFSLRVRLMSPYSCINDSLNDIQDILHFANFVTTTFPLIAEKANAYVDNLKTQNLIPPHKCRRSSQDQRISSEDQRILDYFFKRRYKNDITN